MTEAIQSSLLAVAVDRLIEALENLSGDLDTERKALTGRTSADDLEHIAVRKSNAVEAVGKLYTSMREALVSVGGDGRIEDAMSQLRTQAPGLGARVDRLVELTRACQRSNQENGALIGAGLRNSLQALGSLRSLSAAGTAGTYSASGHTASDSNTSSQLTVHA